MSGSRETPPNRFPRSGADFRTSSARRRHDLIRLATAARDAGNLPRLRIDCGVDDHLLADNREYHRALEQLKIPHEYEEFPGDITGITGSAASRGPGVPRSGLHFEGDHNMKIRIG